MGKVKAKVKVEGMNALLEVGVEEIPARFMPGFLEDLKEKAEKELKAAKLSFKSLRTLGTARRLVVFIEGIPEKQPDVVEEKKGPPKERAYNPDGKPGQAAIGFAKSLGLNVEDLKIKTFEGKDYVFAKKKSIGLPAEKVLSEVFLKTLTSLYLPISMKWGSGDSKFIRPVHWILAVCGSKLVSFEFAGIKSSLNTFGHRYISGSKPLKIKTPVALLSFEKLLSDNGVIIDQNARREQIRKEAKAAAKKAKGEALIEEDLLDEVAYLVEKPSVALGSFNKKYLELPKDILITSMKKNQKYFAVLDAKGALKSNFVVATDCPDSKNAQATVVGNERVLSARLADAKFFYDEDRKASLASRIDDLKKVAFYKKLGTMYDKTQRIKELSLWLLKEMKLEDVNRNTVLKIAELCKADLVTKMVFEFPALQGVMGREYALVSGKDRAVAQGIYEHYLPRFSGDEFPKSLEGTVISIADKLDSIVGCFSIGLIPTGSEDPYALRRHASGIVELILEKKLSVPLEEAIEKAYKLYETILKEKMDISELRTQVLDFLAQRLRTIMLSEGIRYDVADASLSGFSDVSFAYENAKLITKYLESSLLNGIVMTADRVARISKDAEREQVMEADLIDEDKPLYNHYLKVNWDVGAAIDNGENEKALKELEKMTKPVDEFFEKVLVMHKDEKLKTNRLALMKSIDLMYRSLADFPRIVLQKSAQ